MAPGLRLGWIEAAEPLIQRLSTHGYLVSGGSGAPFSEAIIAPLLDHSIAASAAAVEQSAVETNLVSLRFEYSRRAACLSAALRTLGFTVAHEPTGNSNRNAKLIVSYSCCTWVLINLACT